MRHALLLLAPLILAGCGDKGSAPSGDAVAKVAAPAGKVWAETTKLTDDGFLVGNPDAPIRLVEYASLTCGACAQFAATGEPELMRDFVSTGQVSYEFRNFVRDPFDATAAAVVRCSGPDRALAMNKSVFGAQQELTAGLQGNEAAAQAALQARDLLKFAELAKLVDFFAARGVTPDEFRACVGKKDVFDALEATARKASETHGVRSTPTFLVNDEVAVEGADWAALKEKLTAAGAR